ncbi:hypothetical protein [Streptococcus pneumoniae]|nr:hypothetical protein [Streptococcus pneumoniae]
MTESAINDRMNSDKKDLFLKQKMKRFKKRNKETAPSAIFSRKK